MKLAIITGGSRGLGAALVKTYCEQGHKVISIARSKSSYEHDNLLAQIDFDLSRIDQFEILEGRIFYHLKTLELEEVLLINNAAILGELKNIQDCQSWNINDAMKINVNAPLLLISMIIRRLINKNVMIKIFNISSGLGIYPMAGSTIYCTTKAGIEMMTKSIALEQANNHRFKILSIGPGIIDTDMQVEIRQTKKEDLADVDKFVEFKEQNLLVKPIDVAKKLWTLYAEDSYKSGESVSLRS
ncbi:MAG: SDR family NAD(P)-dependent oxidoreductase [Chitinophagales bacterium]